jgi:hypothetical protein
MLKINKKSTKYMKEFVNIVEVLPMAFGWKKKKLKSIT